MTFFEWVLIFSAVASLATLVAGVLFYLLGGAFGPISDIASIVQMVTMVLAAVYAYTLGDAGSFALALIGFLAGLAGMLVIGTLQTLLVLRLVTFEATFVAVLAGGCGIGLWMVLSSLAVAMGIVVPPGLLYLGIAAGIAYGLPIIGYRLGGQRHPLFYIGSLAGVAGYAVWALWLIRAT